MTSLPATSRMPETQPGASALGAFPFVSPAATLSCGGMRREAQQRPGRGSTFPDGPGSAVRATPTLAAVQFSPRADEPGELGRGKARQRAKDDPADLLRACQPVAVYRARPRVSAACQRRHTQKLFVSLVHHAGQSSDGRREACFKSHVSGSKT